MLAVLLLACGVARADTNELRIAQQYGFSYLQLMYMQHEGLIEKHAKAAGLGDVKVTWAKFAAGNVMNDALLSGSLDIASGGLAPPIILWDKTSVDAVYRMLADPEIEFTLTPRQIGNYAQFMYEDGLIKHRPASWKDLFFDNVHALPGS
jgi:ABC-type nitrate/sulfonate/bicarbonate transport system substrate-binding protein